MVTFKLIQLYPGSKPLGYILKPVNNGLTKPDNYYQNGIWFNPSDYPKYWQEVKELTLLEEKVVEKNYEILELSLQRSIKHQIVSALENSEDYTISLLSCNGNKIHSVKRLSDGKEEIFTIGDKTTLGIITCFRLLDNEIMVDFDNKNSILLKSKQLQHIKQPLLITADGVDIFEGDYSYGVHNSKFDIVAIKHINTVYVTDNFIEFSTKEAAEEYILMNKPLLSLSDVWDNLKVKDQKEVIKFVKSKLNK